MPISDSDWQTVPATGGTIEKDDIALTFASGTFKTDAKVAITSVKKGEIGGQYEASPFYQISMPCTAAKPVTVKFKSADKCDDVCVVAHSRAFCMSSGQEKKAEMKYETTYYTDTTETSSMSLVDTPGQYLEIWIHFKDGSKARVVF